MAKSAIADTMVGNVQRLPLMQLPEK